MTNYQGGITDSLDYLPYGEQIAGSNSTTHKFTGYERDAESGLDYAKARYYSSSLGRFMSVDPAPGEASGPQTNNRYAYVLNNPANSVDPMGLFCGPSGCPDSDPNPVAPDLTSDDTCIIFPGECSYSLDTVVFYPSYPSDPGSDGGGGAPEPPPTDNGGDGSGGDGTQPPAQSAAPAPSPSPAPAPTPNPPLPPTLGTVPGALPPAANGAANAAKQATRPLSQPQDPMLREVPPTQNPTYDVLEKMENGPAAKLLKSVADWLSGVMDSKGIPYLFMTPMPLEQQMRAVNPLYNIQSPIL